MSIKSCELRINPSLFESLGSVYIYDFSMAGVTIVDPALREEYQCDRSQRITSQSTCCSIQGLASELGCAEKVVITPWTHGCFLITGLVTLITLMRK